MPDYHSGHRNRGTRWHSACRLQHASDRFRITDTAQALRERCKQCVVSDCFPMTLLCLPPGAISPKREAPSNASAAARKPGVKDPAPTERQRNDELREGAGSASSIETSLLEGDHKKGDRKCDVSRCFPMILILSPYAETCKRSAAPFDVSRGARRPGENAPARSEVALRFLMAPAISN